MRIGRLLSAFLVPLATVCSTVACSSSTDNSTDNDAGTLCEPYTSTADLSQPVSFKKDVMPIFHANCAGCHKGGGNGTPNALALGDADGGLGPSEILPKLVGAKAVEAPDLDLIAPGDPGNSYLMHKMDGDACMLAAQCNSGSLGSMYPNCGGMMPPVKAPSTTPKLVSATRDTVRAWIHQGAQDN
jgi:hypothetical protein